MDIQEMTCNTLAATIRLLVVPNPSRLSRKRTELLLDDQSRLQNEHIEKSKRLLHVKKRQAATGIS